MNILYWWYYVGIIDIFNFVKKNIDTNFKKYYISILYKSLNKPLFGHKKRFEMILAYIIRRIHFLVIFTIFLADSLIYIIILFLWLFMPMISLFYIFNMLVL